MIALENLRAWANSASRGDPAAYDGPDLQDVIAVISRADTAEKWMTLYENAVVALTAARPYVHRDHGTGDWQRKLEETQDLIERVLGDPH